MARAVVVLLVWWTRARRDSSDVEVLGVVLPAVTCARTRNGGGRGRLSEELREMDGETVLARLLTSMRCGVWGQRQYMAPTQREQSTMVSH